MTETGRKASGMPPATVQRLTGLIAYGEDSIVSRTLVNERAGSLTLFAFDAGQRLTEHTSPYQAFVQVLDGRGMFTIGGETVQVAAGEAVLMPANVPHAVEARERFIMLLSMIKGAA